MNSARGQIGLTATVLVAAALPFILTPWKAQALGPTGRGEVGFFGATFSIILACAALGVRYAYYEVRSSTGDRVAVAAGRQLLLAYGGAGIATIVALLIGTKSMPAVIMIALVVACLLSPVQLLIQVELAESQAAQRRKRVASLSSTPALFESAATLVLLLVHRMTVAASIIVTMVSELLRGLVGWVFRRRDGVNRVEVFDLSRRSLTLAPVGLLPVIVANVDTIVFAWFVPTNVLGEYSVAKLAINVMLLAAVTAEGVAARSTKRRALGVIIAALGVCAVLGAVLGYLLTPVLFGPGFLDARYAFVVTSLAGWLGAVFTLTAANAAWRGRGRSANMASVVAVIAITASSLLLGLFWPEAPAWALGVPAVVSYGLAAAVVVTGAREGKAS